MQTPSSKTPIFRCLAVTRYSARMLGKFATNQALTALGLQMTAAADALDAANTAYEDSKVAIIQTRVDVKYADFVSDTEVGNLLLRATLADGKPKGPIYQILAPEGKTPLVRPFGQKQVDALADLEGRINATAGIWADHVKEAAVVHALRTDYETALAARDAAWQKAKNLRVARNVARDQFVTTYLHITLEVKQLFPKDERMQDLYFDVVERDANEPDADPAAAPADPTAPAAPPAPAGGTGATGP